MIIIIIYNKISSSYNEITTKSNIKEREREREKNVQIFTILF